MAGEDLTRLPDGLPVPPDDGACDHLTGMPVPDVDLPTCGGGSANLAAAGDLVVVYVFPRMGRPGEALPDEWNATPGARGCTVQSLVYSRDFDELRRLGAVVFGVSSQTADELSEAAERLELQQPLISDASGVLRASLRLPQLRAGGGDYLRRVTIGIHRGRIDRVWYPVFPPGEETHGVIEWLRDRSSEGREG